MDVRFSNLMRFCFIILRHLYLLSRLPFSRIIHSERIFHSTAVFSIVFQSKCATDVCEFECCALPLSSFIAASPRLIHHSKTLHWKKTKKQKKNTCLATKTLSVCEPSIVVVVARAGLFTVRQIREWATYVFIYLFIFTLRYVIAPFRYLSRPLISAALAQALLHCTVWSTLSRISLTKAHVLWWCDNKSDLIWFWFDGVTFIWNTFVNIFGTCYLISLLFPFILFMALENLHLMFLYVAFCITPGRRHQALLEFLSRN